MARNDLFDLVDLPRLRDSIRNDEEVLETYNETFLEHVREFCGSHYSSNGTEQDNPVNLLSMYVRIMVDQLVPSDPRFSATTFDKQVRPFASTYESWGNRKLLGMGFADILRTTIMHAIFRMGFVKTCITAPASARFGYGEAPGEVYMGHVSLNDMIFDTTSKQLNQADYMGHYYDVFHEDVEKSKVYDKKARLNVVPIDQQSVNNRGTELVQSIGQGGATRRDPYHKKARLCEVWMRRENVIVTFDGNSDNERPLDVRKWVGPSRGPFKWLSLGDVPDNQISKPPVCDLIDQHRDFNMLWSKLTNQATRQKKNHFYRDSQVAKRHEEARDGEYVQCENPKDIVEVSSGGPDVNTMNFAMGGFQLFKQFAGNLDSIAGLSSQGDTATQEKLVHESASGLVQAMGARVISFANDLVGMDGIGWFWWNHPREEMKATYQQPGLSDVSIDRKVTPYDRFGIKAEDIDIEVDIYSFVRQTPAQRGRSLDALMQNVILKVLPLFNQPGVSDMLVEYVRMKAKIENNPDFIVLLEKLMGVQGPPEGQSKPQQPEMPSDTTRTYEHVSRPGMNPENNMQQIMGLMANGQTGQGEGQEALLKQVG